MADLLSLSARFIDEGIYEGPGSVNRVTTELSEVAQGIAFVEAFSHVVAFATDAGLVLFDTSLEAFAAGVLKSVRAWSDRPVHSLVYTHGHVDHVGGAHAWIAEASDRHLSEPNVIGHENVPPRFDRYELTSGYNAAINLRQFGGSRGAREIALQGGEAMRFGPRHWVRPRTTFREQLRFRAGELDIELRHARGETDDHLWAWIPARRALCVGDFVLWVFPNAGNPQKVQRYPLEWARALREMAAYDAELLLPAHGLPIGGSDRIRRVLGDTAAALEAIVEQSLRLMNEGAPLDTLLQEVKVPAHLLDRPYLRPAYDEPEFVVRNVWRLYGGWYDGNPAHLKPAPDRAIAAELATLAGGADALVRRARELAEGGDLRLVELAGLAVPSDRAIHSARAEIYQRRRDAELSLMAKGIFADAARRSRAIAEAEPKS
jgi:alkyl sulfatase BDS1-like metallo-beta-lactamase superfamily hydrolase